MSTSGVAIAKSAWDGVERRWSPPKTPPTPDLRTKAYQYYKTKEVARISCDLRREPGAIIEVGGGTRLQVAYGDGVDTAQNVLLGTDYGGHIGVVKSGSDWVLVRKDGIILIDARVTVGFKNSGAPDILLDMTLKGTIDLVKTFGSKSGEDAYRAYKAGSANPRLVDAKTGFFFHKLTGSARFEGGSGPVDVDKDYADHFTNSAKLDPLKKLDLLVREQFNVVGRVFIDQVPHYDPKKIDIAVLSSEP